MILHLLKVCYVQIWHAHFVNAVLQRIEITDRRVMDILLPRYFPSWSTDRCRRKNQLRRLQLLDHDIITALRNRKTLGPVDSFEMASPRSTAHRGSTCWFATIATMYLLINLPYLQFILFGLLGAEHLSQA
jgi:hypothetical protein